MNFELDFREQHWLQAGRKVCLYSDAYIRLQKEKKKTARELEEQVETWKKSVSPHTKHTVMNITQHCGMNALLSQHQWVSSYYPYMGMRTNIAKCLK